MKVQRNPFYFAATAIIALFMGLSQTACAQIIPNNLMYGDSPSPYASYPASNTAGVGGNFPPPPYYGNMQAGAPPVQQGYPQRLVQSPQYGMPYAHGAAVPYPQQAYMPHNYVTGYGQSYPHNGSAIAAGPTGQMAGQYRAPNHSSYGRMAPAQPYPGFAAMAPISGQPNQAVGSYGPIGTPTYGGSQLLGDYTYIEDVKPGKLAGYDPAPAAHNLRPYPQASALATETYRRAYQQAQRGEITRQEMGAADLSSAYGRSQASPASNYIQPPQPGYGTQMPTASHGPIGYTYSQPYGYANNLPAYGAATGGTPHSAPTNNWAANPYMTQGSAYYQPQPGSYYSWPSAGTGQSAPAATFPMGYPLVPQRLPPGFLPRQY